MVVTLGSTPYRFRVHDYHRMAEADIFDTEVRVELVEGQVLQLPRVSSRHAGCVRRLAHRLIPAVGSRGTVSVHNPIQVGDLSEPQPDLLLLRFRSDFYSDHHPRPEDALLAIEVADSSLRHDLLRKTPLYVAAGIPEVWVIDLVADIIHVARATETSELRAGDTISPLAFPDLVLDVAAILG